MERTKKTTRKLSSGNALHKWPTSLTLSGINDVLKCIINLVEDFQLIGKSMKFARLSLGHVNLCSTLLDSASVGGSISPACKT